MINTEYKYPPSFHAKLGNKLIKTVQKEFNNDSNKMRKFEKLFTDTYEKNLDPNTVVDINDKRNWIFSHTAFPNIKFCKKNFLNKDKSIAHNLITECTKVIGNGEFQLLRTIISKSANNGKNFDEIRKLSEKITNPKRKKDFLEEIAIAERIKKENPSSKLTLPEFTFMSNKIGTEKLQDPNSDLWELMHSLLSVK